MVKTITKATETRLRNAIGDVENADDQYALASGLVESGARIQNVIDVIGKYKEEPTNWYELDSQYKGKDVYIIRENDEYSLKTPPHGMEPKYLQTAQQSYKIAENGKALDPILYELDVIEDKTNIPKEYDARIKEVFKENAVELNKFNGQDLSIVSYGKKEPKAMIVRRQHSEDNFEKLNQQVSNWPNAKIYQVVVNGESQMTTRQLDTLEKSTRNITNSYLNGESADKLTKGIAKHIEPQSVVTQEVNETIDPEILLTDADLAELKAELQYNA